MSKKISRERTKNYLGQIKGSVLYRTIAMVATFLATPLMIGYLGQEQFGVWSTMLAVISWLVLFDLGVGNGMRNKVAASLAKNQPGKAALYVASGYSVIGLISIFVWACAAVATLFIPWQIVFNTQVVSEATLTTAVQVILFFILANFWIGLVSALLGAVQKTSMIALGQAISNLAVLALVYILTRLTDASVSYLAAVYGLSLVSSNLLMSLWFFRRYPDLRPHLYWNKRHVRPLLYVGLQFFIIQVAAVILFSTDKMIIIQLLGPESVTQYDVVFKLFSAITVAHVLVSTPLWSAYTDAYHQGDLLWVKDMLRKQILIFGAVVFMVLALCLSARSIISVWIGSEFTVSTSLILSMGIFALIFTWNNIFAICVNGLGLIRVQLVTAVIAMSINIPLSIVFAKYMGLGLSGIVIGTICSLTFAAIALPIQVFRLLKCP